MTDHPTKMFFDGDQMAKKRPPSSYRLMEYTGDEKWRDIGVAVEADGRTQALREALKQGLITPKKGSVVRVISTNNYEDFEMAPRQEVTLRAVGASGA